MKKENIRTQRPINASHVIVHVLLALAQGMTSVQVAFKVGILTLIQMRLYPVDIVTASSTSHIPINIV